MFDSLIVAATVSDNTRVTELPDVQARQRYWALVDGSDSHQFSQSQSLFDAAIQENPDKVLVFPLGNDGELIWNRLPPSLAVLAAPPQQAAVILVPTALLDVKSEKTIWEVIVDHAEDLQIMQRQERSHTPAANSLPELAPRRVAMPKWLRKHCAEFSVPNVQSPPDAIAIKAGLFQIHGDLDISHNYSQDCQGEGKYVAGDYWHGIMHRREPDYGNSKYWFRRVGKHPVFAELVGQADEILADCLAESAGAWQTRIAGNGWNPAAFIDFCETCERGNDEELTNAAEAIQWVEMLLLLNQTYLDAVD